MAELRRDSLWERDERNPCRLVVEGDDDLHTCVHLLKQFGWEGWDKEKTRPLTVGKAGGYRFVLDRDTRSTVLNDQKIQVVGFVIDADSPAGETSDPSCRRRWDSFRNGVLYAANLQGVQTGLDDLRKLDPPEEGFIADLAQPFNKRVGLWIMPDNRSSGMLENILWECAADNDLGKHVVEATDKAKSHGATIPAVHLIKAYVHCLLAWQHDPGKPYGIAIQSGYLDPSSSTSAARFHTWCDRLFRQRRDHSS